MKFTDEQKNAIEHFKGPALILAVPGSGKTTVLINRINNLIEKYNVDSRNIISITFSKAQGIDMKNRFINNYPDVTNITFKTIHAFCYEIIRSYFKYKNITKTLIESDNTLNRTILIKREYYQEYYTKLTDEQVNDFFSIYDYTKNKMYDFEDYTRKNPNISNRMIMIKMNKIYENLKQKNNYMDFNDLLSLTYKYISEDEVLLKSIKKKYKFFQVDEGQDTSSLQFEIIKKIVFPENNIFVVADDDQSIYSFRGASPENLLNFKNIFPNSKIYFMDKNFRSTKNIITISNKIITENKYRYDKTSKHTNEDNSKIVLYNVKNSAIEMREISKQINELPLNESLGILYRNNISSIYLANEFMKKNIDFYVKDNKFDFYSNRILIDIMNILSFSEDTTDLNKFKRIYYKLNAYIKKEFINSIEYKSYSECVLDSLLNLENLNEFYLRKFSELYNNFGRLKKIKMSKKIDFIFNELGYGDYIDNYNEFSNTNPNLIIDLLKTISANLEYYDKFIEKIDYIKNTLKQAQKSTSNVSISTIHSAKGLEYDNVIIIDLVDGEFPQKNVLNSFDKNAMEEERRLFYVAMTRAKKRLYLYTLKNRNDRPVNQSIFYKELKKVK